MIIARRRDGTGVELAPGVRIRLADVVAVDLGRGYRVVPLVAPRGATLVATKVERQPTNPNPGPSLRVELARRGPFHVRTLAVRLEPSGNQGLARSFAPSEDALVSTDLAGR